jgi:hypothetical protein
MIRAALDQQPGSSRRRPSATLAATHRDVRAARAHRPHDHGAATLDLFVYVPIERPDRCDGADAPRLRRRVDQILRVVGDGGSPSDEEAGHDVAAHHELSWSHSRRRRVYTGEVLAIHPLEVSMLSSKPHLATVRSDTRSVTIDAPPEQVFEFIADPLNLPIWAVGFCRAIRRDETAAAERWIVTTAQGDLPIRFVTHRELGTVDFHFTIASGVEAAAFSRVLANQEGAEYVFTQFQTPGMPDEAFAAQVRALVGELQVLRSVISARAACPA